jgi:hypothetical protein
MRLIKPLLICFCFFVGTALSQERITQVKVGPYDNGTRIVVAFVESTETSYKMQSMIVDFGQVKSRKEQPASFQVDLTSTVRALSTGAKQQKILVLRWKKPGDFELKCDGKWVKQEASPMLTNIVDVTQTLIDNVPVDAKKPTDATLPQDVEQKIISLLNSLDTQKYPCLRSAN